MGLLFALPFRFSHFCFCRGRQTSELSKCAEFQIDNSKHQNIPHHNSIWNTTCITFPKTGSTNFTCFIFLLHAIRRKSIFVFANIIKLNKTKQKKRIIRDEHQCNNVICVGILRWNRHDRNYTLSYGRFIWQKQYPSNVWLGYMYWCVYTATNASCIRLAAFDIVRCSHSHVHQCSLTILKLVENGLDKRRGNRNLWMNCVLRF